MDTLEALTAQLATTQEIQSIVRVMKSLSAVSIHQYENAVDALTDYRETVEKGLHVVLTHFVAERGRLPQQLSRAPSGRSGLLVIGSDRGLCGRFNETIAGFARGRLDATDDTPAPVLGVVGLRTAARLQTSGHDPDRLFSLPGSVGGLVDLAQKIVIELDDWQSRHNVDTIHVCHNRRGARSTATPFATQLLPIPQAELTRLADAAWPSRRLPTFSMAPEALLSWLVKQHLFLGVYEALAQSMTSEHAARLAAMQAADRNIDERRQEIEASYRHKRQESITRELLDIVAGFEAAGPQG